jgi:putative transposase
LVGRNLVVQPLGRVGQQIAMLVDGVQRWVGTSPHRAASACSSPVPLSTYNDMIYAASPAEVEQRRRAFLRKWRLKCKAVSDSLQEAGDRLFTFTRLPPSQWKSARTTNAIERLHEEFKRRVKTQTVLPSAETAAMLFWVLLASGQITMRKVDGWQSLTQKLADNPIDLAA